MIFISIVITFLYFLFQDIYIFKIKHKKIIIIEMIRGLFTIVLSTIFFYITNKDFFIDVECNLNNFLILLSESIIINIIINIFLKKCQKIKVQKKYNLLMISLLCVLFAELLVFNYKHYLTFFNHEVNIDKNSLELVNLTDVDDKYKSNNSDQCGVIFNLKDLDLNSFYIKISNNKNNVVDFDILVYEYDSKTFINMGNSINHKGIERSYYKYVHQNYPISKVFLKLKNKNSKSFYTIDKIAVNPIIPVQFSVIRVVLAMISILIIYIFRPSSNLYKIRLLDNNKVKHIVIRTSFFIIGIIMIVYPQFSNIEDNQFVLLTKSLLNGHVNLDVEVNDFLKNIEDPYNYYARTDALKKEKGQYFWDFAYYNGKYYSYFGIVPILFIYVPFYILTKRYISIKLITIIGILGILIGVILLLNYLIKRYFPNISVGIYLLLFSFIIFGNHYIVLYAAKISSYYIVPILFAIMFCILGIYFWLRSKDKKGHLINKYILLGSISMALVGGCRPNLLITSFSALPIFWDDIKNKRVEIKNILCFIIPFVIIGSLLMIYNYIRFGSVFEFGVNYQLTVAMDKKFNIEKIAAGFYYYLLAIPKIGNIFPFIDEITFTNSYLGYFFYENTSGGVLMSFPLLIVSLFIFKFKKYFKNNKFLYSLAKFLMISVMILVCIDVTIGGVIPRYYMDFNWMIALSTVIIILGFFNSEKNLVKLDLFKKIIIVLIFISFGINFLLFFSNIEEFLKLGYTGIFYNFYYALQFWL